MLGETKLKIERGTTDLCEQPLDRVQLSHITFTAYHRASSQPLRSKHSSEIK